jgi:phosphotriesterase-related protein
MTRQTINSATGPIEVDALGVTLMHEHLLIGYPGWEADTLSPGPTRRDCIEVAVERIQEMQAHGICSLLDPCPSDLGRDVTLAAEVAARTGFNIVVATGFYKEDQGGKAYWDFYRELGQMVPRMADLMIREIDQGVADTGIRPGVIKVATGVGQITDYEYGVLEAAAIASCETGTPITTHTDQGTMGPEQLRFLVQQGVPPHRIVVGHSCGNPDPDYHEGLAVAGAYLGFDRFGLEVLAPDAQRVDNLVELIQRGYGRQVVVSHDCVFCTRGKPFPDALLASVDPDVLFNPTHFHRHIMPRLRERGLSEAQLQQLLVHNPRRYFSDEAP